MSNVPQQVVIVAGEVSGDKIAAALIRRVKELAPTTMFRGVTGPAMRMEGCLSDARIDDIAVMGISDVLWSLPRLLRLRKRLIDDYLRSSVDLFIGVDAPEFNLSIEKKMKAAGVPTIHYVCPQVWAWRRKRANKFASAIDRMLALFPFEVEFFENRGVETTFVGHPLASRLPLIPPKKATKSNLNFETESSLVALMPGSRRHEVVRHLDVFLKTAQILCDAKPECQFVLNLVNDQECEYAKVICESFDLNIRLCVGDSSQILTAADVAIVASGTVTLEALLCGTPMVVGYRLAPLSYVILRQLVKIQKVALPNILSATDLVPEYIQSRMTPGNLASSALDWLNQPHTRAHFFSQSRMLHKKLISSNEAAGDVVVELLGS